MEDLNIKGMFQNPHSSSKLQRIGLYSLVEKIKYKCEWYGREFIQISRWFPSSKNCSNCGYYYKSLEWNEREWTCPHCGKTHDRDLNAAKNILNEGINIFFDKLMNLWSGGDSTVILLSIESTSP